MCGKLLAKFAIARSCVARSFAVIAGKRGLLAVLSSDARDSTRALAECVSWL